MRTDLIKKAAVTLFLLVTSLFSGGCTTMMSHPFPGMDDSYKIGITNKNAPEGDWAPGVYSLGKTNICFAETQGGSDANGAQFLFDLIGRAVAEGNMASETKQRLQGQETAFTLSAGMTRCMG